jgi:hypothetical protein
MTSKDKNKAIVVYRDVVFGGVSMAYICKEARTESEAIEEFLRRSGNCEGWEIVRVREATDEG